GRGLPARSRPLPPCSGDTPGRRARPDRNGRRMLPARSGFRRPGSTCRAGWIRSIRRPGLDREAPASRPQRLYRREPRRPSARATAVWRGMSGSEPQTVRLLLFFVVFVLFVVHFVVVLEGFSSARAALRMFRKP